MNKRRPTPVRADPQYVVPPIPGRRRRVALLVAVTLVASAVAWAAADDPDCKSCNRETASAEVDCDR